MFTGRLSWRYWKMMDIYSRDVRLLKPWQSDEPEAMTTAIAWCGFMGLWTLLLSVVPLLFLPFVHLCRQLPWNFSFSPALQSFPPCLCSSVLSLSTPPPPLLFSLLHTSMLKSKTLTWYSPTQLHSWLMKQKKKRMFFLSFVTFLWILKVKCKLDLSWFGFVLFPLSFLLYSLMGVAQLPSDSETSA